MSKPAPLGPFAEDAAGWKRASTDNASVANAVGHKLTAYRIACREMLAKRLPARRVSEADLDVFERAIAKIEAAE